MLQQSQGQIQLKYAPFHLRHDLEHSRRLNLNIQQVSVHKQSGIHFTDRGFSSASPKAVKVIIEPTMTSEGEGLKRGSQPCMSRT
jgi:hypothetical protein